MKKVCTTVLMSLMTIFTVSAQDFEAGVSTSPFDLNDFSTTASYSNTTGYDVEFGEYSNSFSVTYSVPYSVSSGSNFDIEYTFVEVGSFGYSGVDSIEFYVDGTLVSTESNPTFGSLGTFSLSNISGNNLTVKIYSEATGTSFLKFDYFSLTNTTSSSVGIEETNISDTYNVYSYNNNLVVNTDNYTPSTLTVYNMSGEVVMNQFISGNVTQPIDVPAGIYLVKVKNENGVVVKKIKL